MCLFDFYKSVGVDSHACILSSTAYLPTTEVIFTEFPIQNCFGFVNMYLFIQAAVVHSSFNISLFFVFCLIFMSCLYDNHSVIQPSEIYFVHVKALITH